MSRKITSTFVVALAASAVLLTGCGGSETATEPATTTQPSASSAPSTSTAASPSETTAASPSETTAGSDDAGKPSKKEVVAGLAKFYEDSQGLTADQSKKFATCMVDEMYDKAKTKTLIAMRDGEPTKADMGDASLIAQAGIDCASSIA